MEINYRGKARNFKTEQRYDSSEEICVESLDIYGKVGWFSEDASSSIHVEKKTVGSSGFFGVTRDEREELTIEDTDGNPSLEVYAEDGIIRIKNPGDGSRPVEMEIMTSIPDSAINDLKKNDDTPISRIRLETGNERGLPYSRIDIM